MMKKILVYVFLTLVLLWAVSFSKVLFWDVPRLKTQNPLMTSMMRERGDVRKQQWVPLSRISRYLQKAVILAEDGSFYSHDGIDYRALKTAFKVNWKKKRFALGGSTITMQLAKNLYFTSDKNVFRKLFEMIVAKRMEQVLTKKRILEIYLNVIEWGRGIYGAQAAGRYYFGVDASNLTEMQAAGLAAVIPNPVKLRMGKQAAEKRRQIILARMGYKPPEEKNGNRTKKHIEEEPIPEELFSDDEELIFLDE